MRIAIVGSRKFPSDCLYQIDDYIRELARDVIVVSGGASGVDQYAVNVAKSFQMRTAVYPANWERYGKGAGMIRNKEMIDTVNKVTAFWDGASEGTRAAIAYARKLGLSVEVIYPKPIKLPSLAIEQNALFDVPIPEANTPADQQRREAEYQYLQYILGKPSTYVPPYCRDEQNGQV